MSDIRPIEKIIKELEREGDTDREFAASSDLRDYRDLMKAMLEELERTTSNDSISTKHGNFTLQYIESLLYPPVIIEREDLKILLMQVGTSNDVNRRIFNAIFGAGQWK